MANEPKPHNRHSLSFASDEDAWDKADEDFKEHFRQVMMGTNPDPNVQSQHHIPDEEEGDEEYEGQTEADRQREREE